MNKEKIVKLLKKGTRDDMLIAFHLLKDYTFEEVSNFVGVDSIDVIDGYCHFNSLVTCIKHQYYKINDDLYGYIGAGTVAFRTASGRVNNIETIDL